jgi:hypothetical protein
MLLESSIMLQENIQSISIVHVDRHIFVVQATEGSERKFWTSSFWNLMELLENIIFVTDGRVSNHIKILSGLHNISG